MIVIRNRYIPFKGFTAMFVFGFLFVRSDLRQDISDTTMNHERIHAQQCKEMFGVFFYLWYVVEYLFRLLQYRCNTLMAYRNICFEQEAHRNQDNKNYLAWRKPYSWIKYIKIKKICSERK